MTMCRKILSGKNRWFTKELRLLFQFQIAGGIQARSHDETKVAAKEYDLARYDIHKCIAYNIAKVMVDSLAGIDDTITIISGCSMCTKKHNNLMVTLLLFAL